jgi:hypothetical protein
MRYLYTVFYPNILNHQLKPNIKHFIHPQDKQKRDEPN